MKNDKFYNYKRLKVHKKFKIKIVEKGYGRKVYERSIKTTYD